MDLGPGAGRIEAMWEGIVPAWFNNGEGCSHRHMLQGLRGVATVGRNCAHVYKECTGVLGVGLVPQWRGECLHFS